ncbi:L-seryl-tRNA(Sec) selenium transferase [Mesobacillus persicus]|uniref:L-seryl-tRNA(Sec) selenium transferase n=1 Tax=Mesobacillus persicus TaxID=930146 RepID=A0A1H7W885_9BACI|nr:L-seryl-tRNA(Sec) selenium transferase [Mesobacillus persicus]SEM17299.1 L-seryl-tRNA(Sec) selenium transferase [Mesobacillus persicus]
MKEVLRQMPPVHELQKDARFALISEKIGIDPSILTNHLKDLLSEVRQGIVKSTWNGPSPGEAAFLSHLFEELTKRMDQQQGYTLKPVINATGTILHTNLGRARLSDRAVKHVVETAQNYSNLEYKLQEGKRGSRHSHAEELLKEITGAEAAMVVNNNAAAVFLILRALAEDKEVIVSRGQLVEIGGSFRISSIMEESGAKLVEVGTTNKTHAFDYERAICEDTRMILKVHTSNFKIMGFTKSVETEELASIAEKHKNVIFYEDLGSGVLYDFRKHGIGEEPVVSEVLRMGADIVSFSGDKLLGGPQAGMIAGKKEWIDKLKSHQLARVLRVDKMTLAALEATLTDYLKGEKGIEQIPTIRDLLMDPEQIKERAKSFIEKCNGLSSQYTFRLKEGTSQVGGGTMPDVELPTFLVAISHTDFSAEQLARRLRMESTPAIIVRIQKEEVHLDLRTVDEKEENVIVEALASFQ